MRLRAIALKQTPPPSFWKQFEAIGDPTKKEFGEGHLDRIKALMRLSHLWF